MSKLVCQNAILKCSSGSLPCPLKVISNQTVKTNMQLAATINDFSIASINSFGTCQVLTAAAQGVPQPCIPQIVAPWIPGSPTVLIQNQPALNAQSKAICVIGGAITIEFPGEENVTIP